MLFCSRTPQAASINHPGTIPDVSLISSHCFPSTYLFCHIALRGLSVNSWLNSVNKLDPIAYPPEIRSLTAWFFPMPPLTLAAGILHRVRKWIVRHYVANLVKNFARSVGTTMLRKKDLQNCSVARWSISACLSVDSRVPRLIFWQS